jgi:outer membrane protein W
MRRIALALVVLAFPVSLMAQSSDIGIWVNTTNFKSTTETDPDFPGSQVEIDFDQKMGYGVTFNSYFSQNFSTEFGAQRILGDAKATLSFPPISETVDIGEFKSNVFSGIVQWHFAPGRFIDPYIGGGASYFQGAQLKISDDPLLEAEEDTIKFDNKIKFTANAGVSIALTKGMSISLDGRYTPYEAEERNSSIAESVKLDPLTISLGIRLKR